MSQVDKVCDLGHTFMVAGDVNIDLFPENYPLSRRNVPLLTEIYNDHINRNNLSQLNFEPTRHWPGKKSTLIDHFMTNAPNMVDGVQTLKSHIADHSLVKLQFHSRVLKSRPQFRKVRNFSNVNSENIMHLI